MAFTGNFTCNGFRIGLADGTFNFGTGTTQVFKIALYTSSATIDSTTTAYTATGEVASGSGYTTGGNTLTIVPPANWFAAKRGRSPVPAKGERSAWPIWTKPPGWSPPCGRWPRSSP